jgi:exodeoxyribonuclease VII small subunit
MCLRLWEQTVPQPIRIPFVDRTESHSATFTKKRLDTFVAVVASIRRSNPLAKFEECLQRLEKIVQELEKGEVPLEKSLTLFEEGMNLSSTCRKELEQAEGKVEILLKKNGKLQAEPFEPLTEKAPARG